MADILINDCYYVFFIEKILSYERVNNEGFTQVKMVNKFTALYFCIL